MPEPYPRQIDGLARFLETGEALNLDGDHEVIVQYHNYVLFIINFMTSTEALIKLVPKKILLFDTSQSLCYPLFNQFARRERLRLETVGESVRPANIRRFSQIAYFPWPNMRVDDSQLFEPPVRPEPEQYITTANGRMLTQAEINEYNQVWTVSSDQFTSHTSVDNIVASDDI